MSTVAVTRTPLLTVLVLPSGVTEKPESACHEPHRHSMTQPSISHCHRRQAKEVSFCELPEIVVEKLIVWDDYESEYTTFDVCGTEIRVLDEELAEALKQLQEQSRNIVLMFFFLDMSDSEIGEKLNINRSTSYRHRRNSLEEIKKQLKEKKTNEE